MYVSFARNDLFYWGEIFALNGREGTLAAQIHLVIRLKFLYSLLPMTVHCSQVESKGGGKGGKGSSPSASKSYLARVLLHDNVSQQQLLDMKLRWVTKNYKSCPILDPTS